MNFTEYRKTDSELKRTNDLMRHVETGVGEEYSILEIGARDGHFSKILTNYFSKVVALDLNKPKINHEKIKCVQGDVADLAFDDNSFEYVLCSEVLEHIPSPKLEKACLELARVCKNHLIIGVPYKQDIRVGRTTCYTCGKKNPPWGHVNSFDKKRLTGLFNTFKVREVSFVEEIEEGTNFFATFLLDLAGNPYGTYSQEEGCIHCGRKLTKPPERNIFQKVSTKAAFLTNQIQKPFLKPHGNWIHIHFEKNQ